MWRLALALFVASTSHSAALTNEQANKIKESLLHGPMAAITVACPEGYPLMPIHVQLTCATALRVIINSFEERGYLGRYYCPRPGTEYGALFSAITDHISINKPVWTELASGVALFALMHAFPCK